MSDGLVITRRFLPHWRLDDSTYFVTWSLSKGVPPLEPRERDAVVDSLLYFHRIRYHLWAYVVMDDHVHVLMTPKQYALSKVMHNWKSYTAHRINKLRNRTGRFWLPEYYDRIIRNESDYIEKLEYILNNPIRRWPAIKDYRWADWTNDEFSYKAGPD